MKIQNILVNIIKHSSEALLETDLSNEEIKEITDLLDRIYYKRVEEKIKEITSINI